MFHLKAEQGSYLHPVTSGRVLTRLLLTILLIVTFFLAAPAPAGGRGPRTGSSAAARAGRGFCLTAPLGGHSTAGGGGAPPRRRGEGAGAFGGGRGAAGGSGGAEARGQGPAVRGGMGGPAGLPQERSAEGGGRSPEPAAPQAPRPQASAPVGGRRAVPPPRPVLNGLRLSFLQGYQVSSGLGG